MSEMLYHACLFPALVAPMLACPFPLSLYDVNRVDHLPLTNEQRLHACRLLSCSITVVKVIYTISCSWAMCLQLTLSVLASFT